MRLMAKIAFAWLIFVFAAAAQVPTNAQSVAVKEIERTIRERLDAYAQGRADKWANYVADECFCGGLTKAGILLEISARPKSLKNWYGGILDLKVNFYGETATVRYRTTEYSKLGSQKTKIEMWRTETFVRRANGWKLIAGADSIIPQDPPIAKIDPKIYDDYVGKYEYTPGVIDTISRDGNRLFVQPTGQPKEEIFPENETTFFGKGQDWRMIFVRDAKDKIISVVFRQNGQDYVAKKL